MVYLLCQICIYLYIAYPQSELCTFKAIKLDVQTRPDHAVYSDNIILKFTYACYECVSRYTYVCAHTIKSKVY